MTFENQVQGQFRVDVKEDDGCLCRPGRNPGREKGRHQRHHQRQPVAISAEVKRERQDKQGEKVCVRALLRQGVSRLQLEQDVDEATAQAKYNEGVLELRLPKKAAVTAKKLSIQ